MAGVVPNAAEVDALNYILNKDTPEDILLKLFTNNVTPAETDTAAAYTEAAVAGYAAITLGGAAWTVTGGDPTQGEAAAQLFTMTAAGNFYGYFMVRQTSGVIVGAERFSGAPYALPSGGGDISVTPTYTVS